MLSKIGKGLLLAIGILMILSVTVFDPADITEYAKRHFGLTTGPRADRDIGGMAPTSGRETVEKDENASIRALVEDIRIADTRETISYLSQLDSRVVGYPGCEKAAQYVEDQFRSIGLQGVRSQPFQVTVPIDEGGFMEGEGLGGKVELFALWPNEVQTSTLTKDFTGTLIDGRKGQFSDFNGKPMTRQAASGDVGASDVANAVVLMDFDCGQNWMHAAMIGAKAILFFDNGEPGSPPAVTRGEAEQKFIGVPANIPRFWLSAEDGRRLRQLLADRKGQGIEVRLKARMEWRRVETRNILGVIPGTQPPVKPSEKHDYERQRIIVLSAFYDAMSVVPRIAPGAENACGLAALLQTAKVLKQFPPRHTIVFLATSSHFHCMWGVQQFLHECLPTEEELERDVLPKGRVDFDVFVGLDLTSHYHQVATTCFGTFYNRGWEMNVYRKNLLAPYAKHFTEYAARVFRKSMSEATCPHINAITPPKKTWKNFVPRPVAFDAEAVVARGRDGITLFTPHEIRNVVDTPNDTIDRMDLEKLHTQVKSVAAVIAKAGRDVGFFTDSKLHLENRIQFSRGNVTWFDRAVNPNIPKAPIGGAVVTFRHPGAGVTNGGVRTLYTAYSQPSNPRGGDYREGYYIKNVTLNSRRVRVSAWSDKVGDVESATVRVQSHKWLRDYALERMDDGRALIEVAERFVLDAEGGARIPGEEPGRWEPAPADLGKRFGAVVEAGADDPNFPTPEGHAHIRVGNARFRGPVLVPAVRYEAEIDLDPPGWFDRWSAATFRTNPIGWFLISAVGVFVLVYFLGQRLYAESRLARLHVALGIALVLCAIGTVAIDRAVTPIFGGAEIPEVPRAYEEPEVDAKARLVRSLVIQGSQGRYEPTKEAPVSVAFGDFEGQFVFPFVYFWQWSRPVLLAYKLDSEGTIVYAQDEGSQGKETYPNDVKFGGGAQCVLFRCRPLTVLEIVDSRYLTVLDQVGVLGTDNSVPQQWGARFIANQSRSEGMTVSAAVVFGRYDPARDDPAERHHRLKVHMGTGLYGIKLLLTNAQPDFEGQPIRVPPRDPGVNLKVDLDTARGEGYVVDGRALLNPTYRVAWDMWVLNEYRLRELDKYGISNAMLANFAEEGGEGEESKLGLHDRARYALIDAHEALQRRDYDTFIAESRRAWGFEAKAYPDVASQADDTVKGVVFYFILLIPFAFFMERLLIGSADIRKRIMWFGLIFLAIFIVLRLVHPAFKLSTSPYIILLAFIILAMGIIVLFIVVSKFNIEIRKMKQAADGIQQADVGRLSASYAAVMLGISNLRKRKIRTSLTAVTLTLLTFTVLSFTSINRSLYLFRLSRSNVPSYEGGLVRDRNWRGLQTVVLEYLRSEFKDKAVIAPRAWLVSKTKGEKEFFEFTAAGGRSNVNGIVGVTPQEARINPDGGPQTMLLPGSRWFQEGERYACILPSDVAGRVGILPEHIEGKADSEKPEIFMLGHRFRVVGLIDSETLNAYKDIDDEKLTPVDTLQEAAKMNVQENPDEAAKAPIQAFTHMESSNAMLVPYEFTMDVGGTLRSIAISNFPDFVQHIRKFMERVALNIFVAQGTGEEARVEVLSSIQTTSFSGIGNLFVPILIAALIVLNTMTGAVYERSNEIHIYSSVGLAPTHIAALFLAESAVFATVGAVMGYLIGQTVAGVVQHLGMMGAITLNYSSLSAIYSSVVVMATVFLSTLYPAKKASDMAVPDVTRRWEFPPPEGDEWMFDFPFTIAGTEVLATYAYLARFLQSYGETSIGAFYTEDVKLVKCEPDDEADYVITTRCWLAPYDLGISQDVCLNAIPTGEHNIYRMALVIHRISGDTLSWQRMNRGFLNVLRKQFLVWRTVPSGTKLEFAEEGRRIVGEAPVEAAEPVEPAEPVPADEGAE